MTVQGALAATGHPLAEPLQMLVGVWRQHLSRLARAAAMASALPLKVPTW